ncbi:acetylornithine aminotransferase [Dimargaris cristalligena]|uniref:acetylornithine transaminase n=1 Tax=Dimargaris cristalligena TaxID=215637 RepID=A0A4P9ZYS5_9FUNG|nr:acetylornithine aminotransferase [Dimargaris cristalligena]RKP38528.1 pyridoxal phosphate-dependent transferase [Dimargaris cristalligena]|eukprot:RKP38528.1 pyridoxal phosphate-dependent transferase [Dimargaris cristalligena]
MHPSFIARRLISTSVRGSTVIPLSRITLSLGSLARLLSTSAGRAQDHRDAAASQATLAKLERFEKYTLGTYVRPPVILSQGQGSWLQDTDGRKYLDFTAGIAVTALGHGDPQVAELLGEQGQKLIHTSNLYHNEWAGELASLLVETTCETEAARAARKTEGGAGHNNTTKGFQPGKVFLTNSGTEANEGALKFAKKHGNALRAAHPERYPASGKYEVVSFSRGFHGRSMGALSATAAPKYQEPFQPLVPGFHHVEFNDVAAARAAITESTCAVIVEPIQGEGGIHAATAEFLRALRQRCDEVGALLIFDEIQCGIGRTGQLWGFQHFPADCRPDILTMAKPLANGVPIGAVLLTDAVAEVIKAGDHGTTFGGNPLACRVGHHVFNRIRQPSFLAQVEQTGQCLKDLATQHLLQGEAGKAGLVKAVRGIGMMVGIEFDRDPSPLVKMAREKGLLIITAGGNTVRLVPALTLTVDEARQGIEILTECVAEFQSA